MNNLPTDEIPVLTDVVEPTPIGTASASPTDTSRASSSELEAHLTAAIHEQADELVHNALPGNGGPAARAGLRSPQGRAAALISRVIARAFPGPAAHATDAHGAGARRPAYTSTVRIARPSMDKSYSPRDIESRLYAGLGSRRLLCARRRGAAALLHRDPAAERHRHAAHGPRVPAHADGRADPLPPHARRPHAVAAGHRPRRHRHADGGRAPARPPKARRATTSAARRSSSASGSGRSSPAARSRARCAGSAPRSTGRATASRWTKACRAPCTRCSCACTRKA